MTETIFKFIQTISFKHFKISLTELPGWAEDFGILDSSLRILICILLGYPIALIHRIFLSGKSLTAQHLYFLLTGLSLGFYLFGTNLVHCIAAVILTFFIIKHCSSKYLIPISWLTNLTYLCVGHYFYPIYEEGDYNWTLPQSILSLRLIGLTYDVYDSFYQAIHKRNTTSRHCNHLTECPSLMEMLGYSFFPTGFIIGPQFSMNRYLKFVNSGYELESKQIACIKHAFSMLKLGTLYLGMAMIGKYVIPNDLLISYNYMEFLLPVRMIYLGVWGKFILYKYIGVWLLNEGACILIGLTYNGTDCALNPLWDGCETVNVGKFEKAASFSELVDCFNANMHHWLSEYVYKRLKFLNCKPKSQLITLLFFALWHGFSSGFYFTFILVFTTMFFERELKKIIIENPHFRAYCQSKQIASLLTIFRYFYTSIFMGFILIPYVFRKQSKYRIALFNTNYIGCYFFFLWPIYRPIVKRLIKFYDGKIRAEMIVAEKAGRNVTQTDSVPRLTACLYDSDETSATDLENVDDDNTVYLASKVTERYRQLMDFLNKDNERPNTPIGDVVYSFCHKITRDVEQRTSPEVKETFNFALKRLKHQLVKDRSVSNWSQKLEELSIADDISDVASSASSETLEQKWRAAFGHKTPKIVDKQESTYSVSTVEDDDKYLYNILTPQSVPQFGNDELIEKIIENIKKIPHRQAEEVDLSQKDLLGFEQEMVQNLEKKVIKPHYDNEQVDDSPGSEISYKSFPKVRARRSEESVQEIPSDLIFETHSFDSRAITYARSFAKANGEKCDQCGDEDDSKSCQNVLPKVATLTKLRSKSFTKKQIKKR